MPVGEILKETLGGIFKAVGRFVLEVIFELLVLGTGRLLICLVRPKSEPSDLACVAVGGLFWIALGLPIYALFRASMV